MKNFNKAKNFYKNSEKSAINSQDPITVVKTMVTELKRSMDKVVLSTGIDNQRQLRTKYFSRSLVIIYTLQTTLDFDNGKDLAIKLFKFMSSVDNNLLNVLEKKLLKD